MSTQRQNCRLSDKRGGFNPVKQISYILPKGINSGWETWDKGYTKEQITKDKLSGQKKDREGGSGEYNTATCKESKAVRESGPGF